MIEKFTTMYVQFITEDNPDLCFTNSGIIPKIGDKLKLQFLGNVEEIIEYEVVDVLHQVGKRLSWHPHVQIGGAKVTLKPILA